MNILTIDPDTNVQSGFRNLFQDSLSLFKILQLVTVQVQVLLCEKTVGEKRVNLGVILEPGESMPKR